MTSGADSTPWSAASGTLCKTGGRGDGVVATATVVLLRHNLLGMGTVHDNELIHNFRVTLNNPPLRQREKYFSCSFLTDTHAHTS